MVCAEALPGGGFAARLAPDRLHLQHGPIDVLLLVDADAETTRLAFDAARRSFDTILPALVAELSWLKRPLTGNELPRAGPVARRMAKAVRPVSTYAFVTPMAAVAGAVADHLLAVVQRPGVRRALVNNGGDVALYLAPGNACRVGLCTDLSQPRALHPMQVDAGDAVGGIATSGWPGRSHSLGIADAVSVLAADAAAADVAATLIANAVDINSPKIARRPASALDDASDLGDRLVTIGVGDLSAAEIDTALERGLVLARALRDAGHIHAAWLHLQAQSRVCLPPSTALSANSTRGPNAHALRSHTQARHRDRGNPRGGGSQHRSANPTCCGDRDHRQSLQRAVPG